MKKIKQRRKEEGNRSKVGILINTLGVEKVMLGAKRKNPLDDYNYNYYNYNYFNYMIDNQNATVWFRL